MSNIFLYFIYFIIFIILLLVYFRTPFSMLEKSYTCNYIAQYNINNQIFIYSSNFLSNNKLLLIGVSYPYNSHKLTCRLMYDNQKTICNISIKKLYNIHKQYNFTLIALYVEINNRKLLPKAIIINKNILPLINHKPTKSYNIILAIVNFHGISNYKQVIDVIEISRIYGVDHIVIYVTSSTLFIKNILYYYMKSKYVELIPFCFNDEMKYVRETGQLEKMNDILYRYMHHTKYIIYNDIDEVILPIKTGNYLSFMKALDNQSSDMYLFKSKLFSYRVKKISSIINYEKCCFIKRGYEKYIIGNLYKYSILDVHKYFFSKSPIKINNINESDGYVRHTRYYGWMCKSNLIDKSLDYLKNYLSAVYSKFETIYQLNSNIFYYGRS